MSNQNLINQLIADKVRLADLITTKNQQINNNSNSIINYNNIIQALNDQIVALEAEIVDLQTQIANDDLIIAYIPPVISKNK